MLAWDPLTLAGLSGWTWGNPFLFVSPTTFATQTGGSIQGIESHAFLGSNLGTSCAALLAFAALIALSVALGTRVCRRLALDGLTRAERFVFSSGFGLSAVALVMTILGLLQLWNVAVVRALLLGSALLVAWLERTSIRVFLTRTRTRDSTGPRSTTWCERGTFALGAVAVACLAILGLVPQSFYDGLVYHQGVPNQWMQNGGITFLPGHFFSNFPLSHGVLGATLRFIGPDVTVGLLQPFCLAVSLIALACARRRVLPDSTFPVEGLVLLASLTVVENAPRAGNDLFVMMFFSLSFLALVRWRQTLWTPWVIALGFFLGAALSAKYTAAPYILVVASLLFVLRWRTAGTKAAIADMGRLALAGIVMPLPWLMKNLVVTGNPVWPLLRNVFETREVHEPGLAMATRMAASLVRSRHDLLTLPWEVSLSTPDIALLIGPVFLMLLPVAVVGLIFAGPRAKQLPLYMLAVFTCWIIWALTFRASRYASPPMAATALLYGLAINHILAKTPRVIGIVVTGVTTVSLWLLTSYFLAVGSLMHGAPAYHGGAVDTRGYFTGGHATLLPHHAHSMFEVINHLGDDVKVLILGDNRTFGLQRPHVSATIFDRPVLSRYLERAQTADELHTRLGDDGITHVAVNFLEGVRLHRHFGVFGHPPEWQQTWSKFWRSHTDTVAIFDGMVLVEIVAADTPGRRTVPEPIARIVREAEKAVAK